MVFTTYLFKMAKNLQSYVFSIEVFQYLCNYSKIVNVPLPRTELHQDQWMPAFFIEAVAHITYYRIMFFQEYLNKNIRDSADTFSKSSIDFYIFFKDNVAGFSNKDMVIFDKIFMSLAFAYDMCYWCADRGENEFLHFAPICWDLFFQAEMMDQFHDEGGWEEFIIYAEHYRQSKIFSLENPLVIGWSKNCSVNVKELFLAAMDDYDLLELVDCFKGKLQNRKDQESKFCLQCLPVFTALSTVVYRGENFTFDNILIEGYIQILLQMLSETELKALRTTVIKNLKFLIPEIFDSIIPDHLTLNHFSNEETMAYKLKQIELEFIEIAQCKKAATKILIKHLFEEVYFECDYLECDCCAESNHDNYNTCMFCAKEVCLEPEPTANESLREEIKLIRSAICDTIKTTEKNTSITKIVNPEAQSQEVDNHILTEEESLDEKDALRMFLVLGVEPSRTNMLNTL